MSSAFKKIKKVVKKVGPGALVKKAAKRIKKLGSSIWKGAKGLLGKVGKAFGKLGPLGTIALSLALPGLGTAISAAWGNAITWMGTQGTFLQAVGQGMQYVSNAAGYMKQGFSRMTDTISKTFSNVGGSITEGANKMFTGAQEFMKVKDPMSIQDVGKWVADKAKSVTGQPATPSGTVGGVQASPVDTKSFFSPDPSLSGPFSPAPVEPSALQQTIAASDTSMAGQLAVQEGFTGGVDQMNQNLARQAAADKSVAAASGTGKNLAKEAAKALGSSLLGQPSQPTAVQPFQPVQAANTTTGRGGIGGTGAGGGQFLSQQQLAAIQAFNKNLEEIG